MPECWKCGGEIEMGTECRKCDPWASSAATEAEMEELRRAWIANSVEIDWDKVVTLEDLKHILKVTIHRIEKDSPAYFHLKRFLKDK